MCDDAMVETFEAMNLPCLNFLRKFRDVLRLWAKDEVVDAHEKALVDNADPNPAVLQQFLKSCNVASAMFQDASGRLDFINYYALVKKSIQELEYHSYAPGEVSAFKKRMYAEVSLIKDFGHFDGEELPDGHGVTFAGRVLKVPTTNLNDLWQYPLWVSKKLAAMNSGEIKLLPWEKLLWAVGHIPGAPQTLTVPAEFLDDVTNVRDAVTKALVGKTKFKDMISIVKKNEWSYLQLEKNHAGDYFSR